MEDIDIILKQVLKKRPRDAHKGDFGRLLCVCGSRTMTGAAYMAVTAAVRSGAGIVVAAVPECIHAIMAVKTVESMTIPCPDSDGVFSVESIPVIIQAAEKSTACLIGCGVGSCAETVIELLKQIKCPVILDADGINALSSHIDILYKKRAPLILTPHPGEMSRLLGGGIISADAADRINIAREFAVKYGVTLALKGAGTVVASPEGKIFVNTTGNPGMARGGSGDVLAGIISGLCAQGAESFMAAVCGVYLHGLAGDVCAERISEYGMTPSNMLDELPYLFKRYESGEG